MAVVQKDCYKVDLVALHSIYERNYAALVRILPHIREVGYQRCIAFTNMKGLATTLTFEVIENSPYTSYLMLKQDKILPYLAAPTCYIRCYHDAQLAEITFAQNTRSFKGVYAYPNTSMHQPDEKRQLNQFLEEWLLRCLTFGYDVKQLKLTNMKP